MAPIAWVLIEILRALSWESHTSAAEYVFNSKAEMQAVYLQDGGKEDRMPKVDFDNETVIAVFAGEKSGLGHRIKIDAIVRDEKDTTGIVVYTITAPEKENHGTQKSYPSHVVVVKKAKAKFTFLDSDSAKGKAVLDGLKKGQGEAK
jgi:hypothetical protein